jgi:hypothetical protein
MWVCFQSLNQDNAREVKDRNLFAVMDKLQEVKKKLSSTSNSDAQA